jgi:hypothetical protein
MDCPYAQKKVKRQLFREVPKCKTFWKAADMRQLTSATTAASTASATTTTAAIAAASAISTRIASAGITMSTGISAMRTGISAVSVTAVMT